MTADAQMEAKPAPRWLRRVSWALTGLAVALNLVNALNVVEAVPKLNNAMGMLWLFGTHAALALALCCVLIPRSRRLPLTQGKAIAWLVFALISVLAFPVSYAATLLFASGGFNRLF